MNDWECGVCGYIHKEENAPEKCPVCEAPQKMFSEKIEEVEEPVSAPVKEMPVVDAAIKEWRCSVSGYLHTGPEPPEKCPICEATADKFEEIVEQETEKKKALEQQEKRWRCSVCGYIHTGDEPPDQCPICAAPKKMFVEIDDEGKTTGEPVATAVEPIGEIKGAEIVAEEEPIEKTIGSRLGDLILKLHLHPIHVHFPNGILPAVFVFLGISIYFQIELLEQVAFFNTVFVLAMLPAVLVTGWVEWQKRYKGIKTAVFITKIICAFIVLGCVNVLVFWRLIDPQVAIAGSPMQLIYLSVAGLMLIAAAVAGHLGGKLVFGSRG